MKKTKLPLGKLYSYQHPQYPLWCELLDNNRTNLSVPSGELFVLVELTPWRPTGIGTHSRADLKLLNKDGLLLWAGGVDVEYLKRERP